MKLNHEQKKHFYEQGFVQIPGVVPPVMAEAALKYINHGVGEGNMPEYHGGPIADLFNRTPALRLAESAIGEGKLHPVDHGQVALRYPTIQDPAPYFREHLDGMLALNQGVLHNFTALAGILLSDLPVPYAGNFAVWPKSHLAYSDYVKANGGADVLLKGTPKIQLPEPPLQITGKTGDMVLCHYLLGHNPAPNVWHHTRYAVFFRLDHVDRHKDWRASINDIWLHFPGIREITGK